MNNNYLINIYERYLDIKKSNKQDISNNDLWKIFEYFSCIKLTEEYNKQFYEYNDIEPNFKELNKMSKNDTGIDCCDLESIIVQCKLRKDTLTWTDCATFFGSQNIFDDVLNETIVRWKKLIITRNTECTLSNNLLERHKLFIDKTYCMKDIIDFCEKLLITPPQYPIFNDESFKLRDYQNDCIDLIKNSQKNIIISLPTGTGKNSVIIYSMTDNLKYLILVPRIILMEQLKKEIIKHKPKLRSKIQLIGDGCGSNKQFDENKNITICVYNSIGIIENYVSIFDKIYIDEAHHINKPEIYYVDNEDDESDDEDNNSDNELLNINYTQVIKDLNKFNNNVYLSATIDETVGFEYFSKDIRHMIELKYLCDYTINIPIFTEDPTNKNICEYLLKNYKNIIIYCNSQKEGIQINKLMNELQNKSSEYIDCKTPSKKREDIIERYKNGDISFLVNVRILVEGFDAPITKGVCFMHLPQSKTTLIQIIGRALRLHPLKTIANIILPFSTKEDEKNICSFMKVIAKNDSRIKTSFENKLVGGYINIDNECENDNNDEDVNSMISLKYNMIYNSMGVLLNRNEIWMKRLEEVKNYLDINGKRPSCHDIDKNIKGLGRWITCQYTNYNRKEYNMTNIEIYNHWHDFINNEKYKEYFLSNEESWNVNFQKCIEFIDKNDVKPTIIDSDENIAQLAHWMYTQQRNYKIKEKIMLNEIIYNKWKEFINGKYKKYFISDEEKLE